MQKWKFVPLNTINNLNFGMRRDDLRKSLNMEYQVFKKNEFSKNTTDDYGDFHIYYDENDRLEAIEFFDGEYEIIMNEIVLMPSNINELKEKIKSLNPDEENHYIDVINSIGIEVDVEGNVISVLVAKKGYYADNNLINIEKKYC